jgi:hypothetical protein
MDRARRMAENIIQNSSDPKPDVDVYLTSKKPT